MDNPIKDNGEVYAKLIEAFGEDRQLIVCIEEMSELTKELCKYLRYKDEKNIDKIKENIIEETADVLILAGQIRNMFGKEKVDKMIEKKIKRTLERCDEQIKNKQGAKNG